jgi:Tol biopolymer transport system component
MRVWDKLKNWVAEEHESAVMYTRLSESSLQYQMGKTGLWRQPDLQLALNWREKEKPTLAWAQRLNPAFERTMVYLKTSEQEYIQEEQNKERLQKKALRRTKMFALVLGSAAVVSLFFMLFANIQRIEVEKQRKIAEQQRELAEEQRVIAEQKTVEAEEQRDIARQALIEAELQKIVADKQTTISQEQRQLAEQKATEAIQLQEVARDNLKQAEEQRKLALQNATEAEKQSKLADEKSREALKRRMVSIAQSMAVKSLQINDDVLKGLVAYQAYRFNNEYDGPERQPDIYTALYKAEKNLRSPSHNVLKGHVGAVNSMVFNNSGNILYSTGGDGKIIRYDLNSRSNSGAVLARNDFINRSLDISNNGRWLACGTARSIIQLYNTSDFSRPAAILEGHRGIVGDVAFTPDNRYLISACTDDRTIRIWNLNNFESTILASTEARVRSIDVSPDGRHIVGSTNDGKLILWDRNAGNSSRVLANEPNNAFYVVSFSNSGNYIAAGDKKGNLKLWNANTSGLVKILRSHSARIVDVKFSPGDKLIATSSYDGTISLWELSQLDQNPVVLQEHDSWVLSIAFSPDGKHIVSSSDEGNLMIVWPTGSDIMAQSFCNLLPRNMTREEWGIYVAPDIDYEKTCK